MLNYTINFPPELFNTHFEEVWKDEHRHLGLWGSGSSGKSFDGVEKVVLRMLEEQNAEIPHRFLGTRKVKDKIKGSLFNQFRERIFSKGLNDLFHITESPMKIKCKNNNEVVFEGLDDADKLNSIEGITSTINEEAIQMTRKDFIILDKSLRSNSPFYAQHIYMYNPIDWNHFFKTEFHDKTYPNSHLIHYTYHDNKFLRPEAAESLENIKLLDEQLYNMYCKGEWAALTGLIFPTFNILDSFPNSNYKVYGLDYGFEHPAALIDCFLIGDNAYYKQKIHQSGLNHKELESEMSRIGIDKKQEMFVSPERADLIDFLKSKGYNVKQAKTGAGSVFDGIIFLKQFITNLHKDDTELQDEFRIYKWKTDKNGDPVTPEQPVKFKDDGIDGVRYGTFSGFYDKISIGTSKYTKLSGRRKRSSIVSGYA